jgi:predicted metal-binding membrane protein
MMSETTTAEGLLQRDRWIVAGGLVLICALSWIYLLGGAGTGMSTAAMTTWQFPPPIRVVTSGGSWGPSYWVVMVLMWWIMMIAMMTPSAAPVVLLYARVYRHGQRHGQIESPYVPTASFVAGYLFVWLVFSLGATSLQWLLESLDLLDAMMMWSSDLVLSGGLLIAAGTYQFSPLKQACLKHCRSPIEFVSQHWRQGRVGATVMGIEHGIYCVGCCWLVMALLFVGGIMNLVWIAGLAIIVLVEKIAPAGRQVANAAGAAMIATGGYLLVA